MTKSKIGKLLEVIEDDDFEYDLSIYEMAIVHRDQGQKGDSPMSVLINVRNTWVGEPYFKVINSKSWPSATKVARISFLEPKFIEHVYPRGKKKWNLDEDDILRLKNILMKPLTTTYYDGRNITVWEHLMAQYNVENDLSDSYDDAYLKELDPKEFKGKSKTLQRILHTEALPNNLMIPDYAKLLMDQPGTQPEIPLLPIRNSENLKPKDNKSNINVRNSNKRKGR